MSQIIQGFSDRHYLKEVFTQLPAAKTLADIEQLLPWNQNSS
ncbi:MAG: transposase domain-containing protein [Candidatus Thiodiazotropha taylori]|nr:transposase domain-containing protein [Candidatus Thiodiazotropha taylori]MCW4334496.1 transposase domain-containing protein [Candidatus Thiodiazotropha endolucinida]